MEAARAKDGSIRLLMSEAEAVVLHETLAFSEWGNGLSEIELNHPVEQKVLSDVQQALVPLIPGLGTDAYGSTVQQALSQIDPAPY